MSGLPVYIVGQLRPGAPLSVTWDYYLSPVAGVRVVDAIKETLRRMKEDDRCVGMIFNGLVMRMSQDDDPAQLLEEYDRRIKRRP